MDALFSRAEAILTKEFEEQKQAEFSKTKQELLANDYPLRFIDNRLTRIKQRKTEESVRSREAEVEGQTRQTTVLIPFVDEVTQPLQRILRPLNVRAVGKPRNWKRSLQQQLKDRTSRDNDPGVVYRLKCGDWNNHTLEKRDAERAYASRRTHPKMDDLTCLPLLSMPFSNSMRLISRM